MAITLNGSTGITSPGGDTSTSLSTGLLTVTGSTVPANGMYLPTTNTLAWATNSTRNMTLDASGRLGVGATSLSSLLEAAGSYSIDTVGAVGKWVSRIRDTSSTAINVGGGILFQGIKSTAGSVGNFAAIAGLKENGTDNNENGYLALFTTPNATGLLTERARIDSSGNLLVGATSFNYAAVGVGIRGNNYSYFTATSQTQILTNRKGTTGTIISFNYEDSAVGSISTNGSATAYNTTSDQRLKENIIDAPSALDSINSVKVRSFDWKADGSHVDYGYIAQELLETVPEAVSVPADPEEMMGVDFGRLTPRLVKAIQELTARLEALEGAK